MSRSFILEWSQIVANVVVIVALIVASATYFNEIRAERRGAALEYVRSFNSEPVLGARNRLFDLWSRTDLSAAPGGMLSGDVLAEIFDRLVQPMEPEEKHQLDRDVVTITTFFDQLQACVDSGVCDAAVARQQAGEYGRSFHCIFGDRVRDQSRRVGSATLGSSLARFAAAAGGCSE